jgi:hypothetical protein
MKYNEEVCNSITAALAVTSFFILFKRTGAGKTRSHRIVGTAAGSVNFHS